MFVRIPSHATNVALAADAIREVLVNPPFHTIPGVFSIRDIGQPTSKPPVRSKFLFCSGMLTFIEDEGKKKLVSELGITKIFDLRSVEERENLAAPPIEGVDNRWLPMAREPRALVMADFRTEKGELRAMSQMYQDILVTHAPIFKEIFEHIRDESDKPALFHCAGKCPS